MATKPKEPPVTRRQRTAQNAIAAIAASDDERETRLRELARVRAWLDLQWQAVEQEAKHE